MGRYATVTDAMIKDILRWLFPTSSHAPDNWHAIGGLLGVALALMVIGALVLVMGRAF